MQNQVVVAEIAGQYKARVRNPEPGWRRRAKPRVLWGVASTGMPHLGYLPYLLLLKQLAAQGWEVIVLVSEFHAYLDDQKTSWSSLQEKYCLYQAVFSRYFRDSTAGSVKLVSGSELYLDGKYFLNLMRHATAFPAHGLLESGQGMLRSSETRFSELLYVYTMMFDVVHLDLDLVLCGEDESTVYDVCFDLLKNAGRFSPCGMYLPLMPGLSEVEMHASSSRRNILRLDASPEEIKSAFLPLRSLSWHELAEGGHFLSYLRGLSNVFSDELQSKWEGIDVADWVNLACMELTQHLAPMCSSHNSIR